MWTFCLFAAQRGIHACACLHPDPASVKMSRYRDDDKRETKTQMSEEEKKEMAGEIDLLKSKNVRGFALLLQSLSQNGIAALDDKKHHIMHDNFPTCNLCFGAVSFRVEIIFVFASIVAVSQILLYIFCFLMTDADSHSDQVYIWALAVPSSLGILVMTWQIRGKKKLKTRIYDPYLEQTRHVMRETGSKMVQEIESRITEVKTIYNVIGHLISNMSTLTDLLEQANK